MDKLLNLLDRIFLATLVAWAILKVLGTPLAALLIIGLLGTACIFFVQAQRPINKDFGEEKSGFEALFGTTILPKVLGISSSVATIGILFYMLKMEGYEVMLMVGSNTIIVAFIILGVLKLRGLRIEVMSLQLIKSLIVLVFALLVQYGI